MFSYEIFVRMYLPLVVYNRLFIALIVYSGADFWQNLA